jgi:glycerophosphoryl diester phosphodiesterase
MSLVIAHRGANRSCPENTIPAFKAALAFGVDGFENDVHMTRDGACVVLHDDTVDRTSDGKGRVCDFTLAQLRALDFGGWFSPDFSGTRIPTLAEWYAHTTALKLVNVEIKSAPKGCVESAAAVVRLAKEAGVFARLLVSSFDLAALQACKREDAACKTALLYSPYDEEICEAVDADAAGFARENALDAYHPHFSLLTPAYLDRCHTAGLTVNAWTVNAQHALEKCRDWGCDGIITDVPDLAMRVVYGGA